MDANRYRKEHKKHVVKIKDLEARVERFASEKTNAVTAAVAAKETELQARIDVLARQAEETGALLVTRETELAEWMNRHSDLDYERGRLVRKLAAAETEAADWKAKYDSQEPRIARAEAATARALADIDRMKEKLAQQEREWKNAIANRQAIAGAVPGRNRG